MISNGRTWTALLIILIAAAALRAVRLSEALPGLSPDESANIWNAWCLLRTGRDAWGVDWPIFYYRALGENRSALFLYVLMPFQWLLGMDAWSARLSSATFGVTAVALLYATAARLFDRATGLIAAGLLAVMPWHVVYSRWAHEGTLCGLLGLMPVAGLVLSGAIRTRDADRADKNPHRVPPTARPAIRQVRARWGYAIAAIWGLATGIGCYGYPSIRLFVPIVLMASLLACRRHLDRNRTVALLAGFAAAFGPLLMAHALDGESINRRGQLMWVWQPGMSLGEALQGWAWRYAIHFGPTFLFLRGDQFDGIWPGSFGAVPTCFALLLPAGAWLAAARGRAGVAARLVLVLLACYPLGDILHVHRGGVHIIRSGPGLCGLVLCAAVGWRGLSELLVRRRMLGGATALWVGLTFVVGEEAARFQKYLHRDRPRDGHTIETFQVELEQACAWLKPRVGEFDRIHVTTSEFDLPFIGMLIWLDHDPRRWLREPREFDRPNQWDRCRSFGNVRFLYDTTPAAALRAERAASRPGRSLWIVRDHEVDWTEPVWSCPTAGVSSRLRAYIHSNE